MGDLFRSIVDNGDRVSSFVLLLLLVAGLGYVAWGFATGKISSPGETKRLASRLITTEEALGAVTGSLSESKALHAAALVRIEFLERDVERRDRDILGIQARCSKVEAELEVLRRDRWRYPTSGAEG
jgi:hypothetical protein